MELKKRDGVPEKTTFGELPPGAWFRDPESSIPSWIKISMGNVRLAASPRDGTVSHWEGIDDLIYLGHLPAIYVEDPS